MSPDLWNPVFAGLDLDWRYETWDVPAGDDLMEVRERLLDGTFAAVNITMPHKQRAVCIADDVEARVVASGATNLLIANGGRLYAFNTDVRAIESQIGLRRFDRALILGAGGAGRAALVGVQGHVHAVTIADRDVQVAESLAAVAVELGMGAQVVEWGSVADHVGIARFIVNATPIGKDARDAPAWGAVDLAPGSVLYDFVYASHTTSSVRAAERLGAEYFDGWSHLVAQAAAMVPLLALPRRSTELLSTRADELRSSLAR